MRQPHIAADLAVSTVAGQRSLCLRLVYAGCLGGREDVGFIDSACRVHGGVEARIFAFFRCKKGYARRIRAAFRDHRKLAIDHTQLRVLFQQSGNIRQGSTAIAARIIEELNQDDIRLRRAFPCALIRRLKRLAVVVDGACQALILETLDRFRDDLWMRENIVAHHRLDPRTLSRRHIARACGRIARDSAATQQSRAHAGQQQRAARASPGSRPGGCRQCPDEPTSCTPPVTQSRLC